ncbi:MAG: phage terminase large subunit, partial [Clostridia bacterium]|nr:phage terminase large subunit [Clostridia bacterium]
MANSVYVVGHPNAKQIAFFLDRHKYCAYGGARGGGKSWAIRKKAALLCLRYDGIKVGIFRRTYPELRNNHAVPLMRELLGVAIYNESKKEFKFPNGSKLILCYADNWKDVNQKFQGQEYDVLCIDEATQIPEEWFDIMKPTIRDVNPFPKRMYLTCNPGGVGHSWVKRLFITKSYKEGERREDYHFIQALPTDNRALMETNPDYIHYLQSLPPKLRKAWLEGSWDIFMGQFFEEFTDDPARYHDRLWTHVIEPFDVPDTWEIYRSFDWGFSNPFSCDWWAVDYDGRAYLILQYYGTNGSPNEGLKMNAGDVFAEIARIEREHRWLKGKPIRGVADSAIWASDGGPAIIESAEANGIDFEKADKTRIPGWLQMHTRFAFDETGRPMMYFFHTCRHAIRTIPLLQYSQSVPEDLDTEGEDHFADSCRYFCMMRPLPPK